MEEINAIVLLLGKGSTIFLVVWAHIRINQLEEKIIHLKRRKNENPGN